MCCSIRKGFAPSKPNPMKACVISKIPASSPPQKIAAKRRAGGDAIAPPAEEADEALTLLPAGHFERSEKSLFVCSCRFLPSRGFSVSLLPWSALPRRKIPASAKYVPYQITLLEARSQRQEAAIHPYCSSGNQPPANCRLLSRAGSWGVYTLM